MQIELTRFHRIAPDTPFNMHASHPPKPTLYPNEVYFDIETLLNVAQAQSILLVGNVDESFALNYAQQKSVLQQHCEIDTITTTNIDDIFDLHKRYDIVICLGIFEHISNFIQYH